MTRRSVWLGVTALACALPALQGCLPLFAGAAVGTGALIAEDRRSSGTYIDDQGIEMKAASRIGDRFPDLHVNVTSFNRVTLLTGEVPGADAKADIGRLAREVPGVRVVQDELAIAPPSSLTARSNDTYLTSKVKARFIEHGKFQVNHVKVITEAGTVYLMGLVKRGEATDATRIAATTAGVGRVVQVFEYID
jgi:osmotically-inducible protein OsmY